MFDFRDWSKARWIACGCLGIMTLWAAGVASAKIYRHYTFADRVASGLVLFEHVWQPSDSLSGGGDGLGPVFNERSCVACHFQGGVGGSGPNSKNVASFEVVPTRSRPQVFRGVVHASAIDRSLQESIQLVSARFPVIRGGVTVSQGCTTKVNDFDPVVQASLNSPALFGAGLIDSLSGWSIHGDGVRRSAQVISRELKADFNGIPIGRARTLSGGRVGKFGWKGQFATLEEFVASACAVELGLTNPEMAQNVPGEFCENRQAALDMTARQLDALVTYLAALPRPMEILPDDPKQRESAIRGKVVFAEVGCAECHTPDLGNLDGVYSDFRLYELESEDSGQGYAVLSSPEIDISDQPKANEWKTPPLWGVADSAPYFHDGGSNTLSDAIQRHAGSAKKSRQQYRRLGESDRQALLAFLATLQSPR